jgi:hypothetical protein
VRLESICKTTSVGKFESGITSRVWPHTAGLELTAFEVTWFERIFFEMVTALEATGLDVADFGVTALNSIAPEVAEKHHGGREVGLT